MIRVETVWPESIGAELGILPGTVLHSVNGRPLHDFLDWEFLTADDHLAIAATLPDGSDVEFDVERPEGLPMGIAVEPPRIRRCGNRCDFCFVDGLPPGLRPSLYVRDDDYRLSFRYGNFATLTNLKAADVERIIEYRLSPLYVSVHAADPVVRRRLLRNPRAPAIIPQLRRFAGNGITFHTQIVLQPGVNDGPVLTDSLDALWALGPSVLSVSVVPVGLTEFSKHTLARAPTAGECREAIDTVHHFGERAARERGHRWVHGSDELYLVAQVDLPEASWYGDFEQVENGVGSVRFLQQRIDRAAPRMRRMDGRRVGVVTGTAMARLLPPVLRHLDDATGGEFHVIPVDNDLFGPHVTTAGLLPGRDIQRAVRDRSDLDHLLIPAEALNDDGVFIDDLSLEALSDGLPVVPWPSYDFADALAAEGPS